MNKIIKDFSHRRFALIHEVGQHMLKTVDEYRFGIFADAKVQFLLAVAVLLVAAAIIPAFPDELARIEMAKSLIATGSYNFFWPPLMVALPALNPMLESGFISVRIVQLALAMPAIFLLAQTKKTPVQTFVFICALPYLAMILSTSTPQGVMFSFLAPVILRPTYPAIVKAILISLACAANPSLIAIIVVSYAALFVRRTVGWKDLAAVCLAIVFLVPWVLWGWVETGHVIWTLSTNGSPNLFLGNNPHPLSYRAAGDLNDLIARWNLPETAGYSDAVVEYWYRDPVGFIANLAYKFIHFPLPTDHFWSLNSGYGMSVVAVYVGATQAMIYATFIQCAWRRRMSKSMAIALAFFIAAWLFHTVFFVKVRYRIPFDGLLLFAIFVESGLSLISLKVDQSEGV